MIFSFDNDPTFVYARPPKTGSTSVSKGLTDAMDAAGIKYKWGWYTHPRADAFPDGAEYYFGFTRNPWEWAASLFWMCLKDRKQKGYRPILGLEDTSDFGDFVRSIRYWPGDWQTPDTDVFRLEDIGKALKDISTKLGFVISEHRLNLDENRPDYRTMFTDSEIIDLVWLKNADQIDRFDYTF